MAINFPATPSLNEIFVAGSASYQWNGRAWVGRGDTYFVPDATETSKGIVELATAAETTAGVDAARAIHPAGLKVELNKKANQATTYTKAEVDQSLTLKANQATTYTKTEVDTSLTLKANQATTYTKTEADAAFPRKDGTGAGGTWAISVSGSSASSSAVAWSGVSGRPTTRDGYGITDVPRTTDMNAALAAKLDQTSPAILGQPYVNGSYRGNVVAVAALDIDCSLGNYFTKTINGASQFSVSNVPSGRSYGFVLELTHTSGAVTWFSGVQWPGGKAPTLTAGKVHVIVFHTDDGGAVWRGSSLVDYAS